MLVAGGALAQGFGFGPPGGRGGGLLGMPEVQKELKLSDDQKTKAGNLMERAHEERQLGFRDLLGQGPEAMQKKMAELRASEDQRANAILTADQQKRYHQLQLQQQGVSAFTEKPVADTLKLTDDQRAKVQAALNEQRNSMRAVFGGPGGPGGPPGFGGPGGPPPGADGGGPGGPPPGGGPGGPGRFDFQAMRTRLEALRKQTDEKVTGMLTDDQKKQWQEMLGAPFTFPAPRFGGPGGRPGFGGPPPGGFQRGQ